MDIGAYTALITPFKNTTMDVDYDDLEKLAIFQIQNGISGILAVGTTGESPTLTWEEHHRIIEVIVETTKDKCFSIAGTGSNNTNETIAATRHAVEVGADAVLLVEPYYNGPSSIEIRKEYIAPVAKSFPEIEIIPYIIPGRTGTQLFPQDLALLHKEFNNVNAVKEATGNFENMKRTREFCGKNFSIFSGDDAVTYEIMTDSLINASGVISVISNIAPKAVSEMVKLTSKKNLDDAKKLASDLEPLFNVVTVKTMEKTSYGEVLCKAKNPLAIKTIMLILGMPCGGCRKPLGKMTKKSIETVIEAVKRVNSNNPEILKPAAEFFNIDIDDRINNSQYLEGFYYEKY